MTDTELHEQVRGRYATAAGYPQSTNVEFGRGTVEDLPFPDAAVGVVGVVGVVIGNCVVDLPADEPAVLRETVRVLGPGGRIGVADVVAGYRLTLAQRAERGCSVGCDVGCHVGCHVGCYVGCHVGCHVGCDVGCYVGCIAGALPRREYVDGRAPTGFVDIAVGPTHEVAPGPHPALIRVATPSA